MVFKQNKQVIKEDNETRILSSICKECDRFKRIPQRFCNDCKKEMLETFNKTKV
jgi:uncharacterized OB-fold protein